MDDPPDAEHRVRPRRSDGSPAHRPSRRNEIIDAAVRQFARNGFIDAAISDVAADADVVVTAIYYHFSNKEELYAAAVERVFHSISEVVAASQPAADPPSLDAGIDAVFDWIDAHPDEAALLYLQLPGATPRLSVLRQEFEERHVQGAFKYLRHDSDEETKARRARSTLIARTLVDMLISVHTMRLADGPLSTERTAELRAAIHTVAGRLVVA